MIQENRQPTQRTDQRMVHTVEYCRDDPDNASPPRHGQHYHNGYEMIYIQSGEAEVTVDRSVYLAKAPCLLIISNLEEHQIRVMERPYVRYYTILTPKLTDRLIANPVLMSVFKNRAGGFRHVIPAEGLQDAAEAFFQGLISEEEEHGRTAKRAICLPFKSSADPAVPKRKRTFFRRTAHSPPGNLSDSAVY